MDVGCCEEEDDCGRNTNRPLVVPVGCCTAPFEKAFCNDVTIFFGSTTMVVVIVVVDEAVAAAVFLLLLLLLLALLLLLLLLLLLPLLE